MGHMVVGQGTYIGNRKARNTCARGPCMSHASDEGRLLSAAARYVAGRRGRVGANGLKA